MKLLEVKELSVTFKEKKQAFAVRRVSFSIDEEQTLAIVGESGSGKSTVALAIANLLPSGAIVSGSIFFKGDDIFKFDKVKLRRYRKRSLGLVFQDPFSSLNPTMKIGSQLFEAIPEKTKAEKLSKAIELLNLSGIGDPELRLRQYPHELSGGLCQRIMIAIAVAGNPCLLIADEPTSALDVTIQAQILRLFIEIRKKLKTSILLITHDLALAGFAADRIAVMYGGKIVEIGSSRDILNNPRHPYTQMLLCSLPFKKKKGALSTIPGPLPNPHESSLLCPFLGRCPKALALCSQKAPHTKGGEHFLSCWLPEEA